MGFSKKQMQCRTVSRWAMRGVWALALWWGPGVAAHGLEPLRTISSGEFRGDVSRLQDVVAACAQAAANCDASKVGPGERVGSDGFAMHWEWLRMALDKAKTAKADERTILMQAAAGHLEELAQESSAAPVAQTEFAKARATAAAVLSAEEFQNVDAPTWWDRLQIRMQAWVLRFFQGVQRVGSMVPWMGTALEWLLFVGAAVGLWIFLLRQMTKQRLRVAMNEAAARTTAWDRESTDWARLAERHAEAGEFREAVHGLYWAAIVALEARRAWRHNPTRTPREYVRLLQPGSARQKGLRGLTQIFERTWYGLRNADAAEYARARGLYEGLVSHMGGELFEETVASGPMAAGGSA